MKYETEENNPDWLHKGPWYNTAIYFNLNKTVFEDFIRNSRTDRHNLMCSITAHDKKQPKYVDDTSSGGGREIPKNATTAVLK